MKKSGMKPLEAILWIIGIMILLMTICQMISFGSVKGGIGAMLMIGGMILGVLGFFGFLLGAPVTWMFDIFTGLGGGGAPKK